MVQTDNILDTFTYIPYSVSINTIQSIEILHWIHTTKFFVPFIPELYFWSD